MSHTAPVMSQSLTRALDAVTGIPMRQTNSWQAGLLLPFLIRVISGIGCTGCSGTGSHKEREILILKKVLCFEMEILFVNFLKMNLFVFPLNSLKTKEKNHF